MNRLTTPKSDIEFAQYFQLRWQLLRKPWQQPLGSEQDEHEQQAIHRMVINEFGEVVAVGRIESLAAEQGQIRYVAVCDSVQGQGVGQQLMAELECQASKVGITEIILNARENALGFYLKLGYQQHQRSHVLYHEINHYRMSKTLPAVPSHQGEQAQALQDVWHNTIPMSKAMGIAISYYDGQQLNTHCDAAFNKNLHNTMFAGSIYTLATLTGWGWIYLALNQVQPSVQGDIVLAHADIRYHAPIATMAYAQVERRQVQGSFERLVQGKKSRIKLVVDVYCGDKIAATFTGQYAVLPKPKRPKAI